MKRSDGTDATKATSATADRSGAAAAKARLLDSPRAELDPAEAALAAHLEKLEAPSPLSPAALGRIEARLQFGVRRARWPLPFALASVAFAALAVVWLVARPRPSPSVAAMAIGDERGARVLEARAGETLSLRASSGATYVLVGPARVTLAPELDGAAAVAPARASAVVLDGRVVIRLGAEALRVVTPDATVLGRAGALLALEVHASQSTVAAYQGAAEVTFISSTQALVLEAGTEARAGTVATVSEEARRAAVAMFPPSTPVQNAPSAPPSPQPLAPSPPALGERAHPEKPAARSTEKRAVKPGELRGLIDLPVDSAHKPWDLPSANQALATPSADDAPAATPTTPTTPSTPSTPVEGEADVVARSFALLHRDHAPARALALLDEYQAKYPHGALHAEAELGRVEALLMTGKRSAALAALDDSKPTATSHGAKLLVTRGELRAEEGRCQEALADFELALGDERVAERALYGRAACRLRLHDEEGGRSDLRRYLQRYPVGAFRAAAERALGN